MLENSHFKRALEYMQDTEYAKAFDCFLTCLQLGEPGRAEVLFYCGSCLELDPAGDKEKALEFFKDAAEESQSAVTRENSLFRAGWLLVQQKDWVRAAEFFRRGIDCDGNQDSSGELYCNCLFWYAFCQENQGRSIEAISWYRVVREKSTLLKPESSYREMICLNSIGYYEEALKICAIFDEPPPEGFDPLRYEELSSLVRAEGSILRRVLL